MAGGRSANTGVISHCSLRCAPDNFGICLSAMIIFMLVGERMEQDAEIEDAVLRLRSDQVSQKRRSNV